MKNSLGIQEPQTPGRSPPLEVSEPVPTVHAQISLLCLTDAKGSTFSYHFYPNLFSYLWSSFHTSQSETPEPENSPPILKNCYPTEKIEYLIFLSLKLLSPQNFFCFALSLPIGKRRSAKAPTPSPCRSD